MATPIDATGSSSVLDQFGRNLTQLTAMAEALTLKVQQP
jgi:hypothetical protein